MDGLPADLDPDEAERAVELLALLERLEGTPCARCARALCGHELTSSVAIGFKDAPVCLGCLAHGLGREPGELREDVHDRVTRRACFLQGWMWASAREGSGDTTRPACLWPAGPAASAPAPGARARADAAEAPPAAVAGRWDAGDMSCGDLVLALRGHLHALPPGGVLELRATDPGAPEDIPAWCRVTRHPLLRHAHPHYWIQRRKDD